MQGGKGFVTAPSAEEGTMTEAEIRSYSRRLLAMKKRLGGALTALEEEALRPAGGEASGSLSNVPVHPADLGTDAYEEELTVGLIENEAQLLQEVNDALDRIEQGRFGRCEACGQEIPRARLDALPYARYCLRDARKLQDQTVKFE
jgi:RNA polymerase-binding transcription factor DksA